MQTGLEPATTTVFHLYINTKYSLKVIWGTNGAPIARAPIAEKVNDNFWSPKFHIYKDYDYLIRYR